MRPYELIHNDISRRALAFATFAHYGQMRKFGDTPYIVHPKRVAILVAYTPGATQDMVTAAYLHDVIEDNDLIDGSIIYDLFGPTVAGYVVALSDRFTPTAFPHVNRKNRKINEAHRLSKMSWEARAIKRADMDDNTRDIKEFDPGFAELYLKEKDYIIQLFDKADQEC